MQKLNRIISKGGVWIFIFAAVYKFTFWIINMVLAFQTNGGYGVRTMFSGLFDMLLYLVILAVVLEVSRKIAEKYTPEELARPAFNVSAPPQGGYMPQNGYGMPQVPIQQAPVQQVPVQQVPVQQAPVQQAPVQQAPAPAPAPAPANNAWTCSACGTQNSADSAFCFRCGKPK